MDRFQAINLLKELYEKIPDLSPQTVDLIEETNNDAPTYSVRFKGLFSYSQDVIDLLSKWGLEVTCTDNELTISSH